MALAEIMNTFPRVSFDNARLWLAYMEHASSTGVPVDSYIMDSFRHTDWWNALHGGNAHDIVISVRKTGKENETGTPNIPTLLAQLISPFARLSKVLAHSVDRVRMIRIGPIEQVTAAGMDILPKAFRTVVPELPWTQFL
ncbi:hypothetical protein EXIGLDRAFT_694657 [Exidia glandulosa HHB12029]|uniref:Uncharacterized protein n=1 Tax=Exidia glandulosa HHB12029 TaxID=1314781 RepID=A0A165GGD1_EXIGL|nr:hypothetical protein EXIGLDRAFT_694657 [Exidia glandulosa HHB12029]